MSDQQPADMQISAPKRSVWRNLSAIWIVPLVALIVTLGVAWQNFASRGTLITIAFDNASGVVAGETTLRYRDVVIGTVEDVGFSEDLSQVRVNVRVSNAVVPFLDEDAQFWVVRPQVSASGISGLATVLSGVYIEGAWDQEIGTQTSSFVGSGIAPLVRPGEGGTRIVLRTDDGTTLIGGAPVLYRGVRVGQLETPRLTDSGDVVLVEAFIEAPHDRLVTTAARFWDASGFSLSFGASGVQLDVESLASLVSGGISFDTIYSGGRPVDPGQVFDLYKNENDARRRPFSALGEDIVRLTVWFDGNVSGLLNGADVTYRGLPVGEVTSLRSELIETASGQELTLKADLAIDPKRIGLPIDFSSAQVTNFFGDAVASGLRARLAAASLFGGELIVELVELPDAETVEFDRNPSRYPIIPSVASDVPNFASTAQGVLSRIDGLPIEEVLAQAINTLDAFEDLARAESTVKAPDEVLALIGDARALIGGEAAQALPDELRDTIVDLRAVVADLRTQNAALVLTDALRSVDQVAKDISDSAQDVPELVSDLRALSQKASSLEIEELIAATNAVIAQADGLLASASTQAVPQKVLDALNGVEQAMNDARTIMGDLQSEGAVQALTNALTSAEVAATQISSASVGLPELIEDLRAVAAKANDVPLNELVVSVEEVLASANALISSDDTKQLPAALTGAFAQIDGALSELRAGGTVENVNATLSSARGAADAVSQAAADLPELTERLNRLVRQSEALIDSYGDRSTFNIQTLGALRDISDAAKSVSRLAREIERNPNSLLFGR